MAALLRFCCLCILTGALHAEDAPRSITWDDLLPQEEIAFDDPFEALTEEQLLDLGMIARIRFLLETEKITPDGPDSEEEKRLVASLTEQGIEVDELLAQRDRVTEMRRKRAEQVDEGLDGERVRIPGYMLPLQREEGGVTEFLLVPWVGACIHTPPPPPNQMIHVATPEGAEDRGRFAAIWLEGPLSFSPSSYLLYLVDGSREVQVAYSMDQASIEAYSAVESDVLAQVEVPTFSPEHSWWQNLQTWASVKFTQAMTAIRDRQSSGPMWIGLLMAFSYGVVHTLGPGHGKAVIISYFIGQGGSLWRGVRMGFQIAVFHVLSSILVVVLTDLAVRQTTGQAPSDYQFIRLISYALIAVIGAGMLWKALRPSAPHTHGAGQTHEGCSACAAEAKGPSDWLALAIGSVPCTGALLVLLFGLANDLLGAAVLLVGAISLGMALAISGIGMVAILGRRWVEGRMKGHTEADRRSLTRKVRIVAASLVLLLGVGLFCLAWWSRPDSVMVGQGTENPGGRKAWNASD